MNSLALVNSSFFGNVQCNFYSDNNDFFMTRKQIGEALEYTDPQKAIDKLHERNKERLDMFSTTVKLGVVEGGRKVSRSQVVYSAKGVYEICRRSEQPKADAFFDFVYEMLERLRTGKLKIQEVTQQERNKNQIQKEIELEARLINARARKAKLLIGVADKFKDYLSKDSIQSLISNATEILSGRAMLPKPSVEKTYTASDIAELAGISANKVGRVANKHNIKQEEYGLWVLDKSAHSNKQVSSFLYNESGKDRIIELVQQE